LDKELFETARQIPWSYRIAKGTTKYVLRKAAEGIVPDFILHRPKLGFPVPVRDWLKEDGSWMWEMIRSGGIEDFIRLQAVEQMLIRHRSGQGDYSRRLWVVLIFALWHSAFMQEAGLNSRKPFPQVS
jgi:asparagine synthase (glutamine-hydrolysing)